MLRARKMGVPAPVVYYTELETSSIYMERVEGKSVKHVLQDGLLDAAGAGLLHAAGAGLLHAAGAVKHVIQDGLLDAAGVGVLDAAGVGVLDAAGVGVLHAAGAGVLHAAGVLPRGGLHGTVGAARGCPVFIRPRAGMPTALMAGVQWQACSRLPSGGGERAGGLPPGPHLQRAGGGQLSPRAPCGRATQA